MARLIIPTRNRPTSLLGVLKFLIRFHPDTELIIADGSNQQDQALNESNVHAIKDSLNIDYRSYPVQMSLVDRLLEVLKGESDELFIMGSDDDYPMMDTLKRGEKQLQENPGCSTAMGGFVVLQMLRPDEPLTATLKPARPIVQDTSRGRMINFSRWPFPTTYAVTRRDVLLERYERLRKLFVTGFVDYTVGVHDATWGTIGAIPDISFICTRNYNHSYLRSDGLEFLRNAPAMLAIKETIKQDLIRTASLSEVEAERTSLMLIKQIISERVGTPVQKRPDFVKSHLFQDRVVQLQCALFKELFKAETDVRKRYEPQLKYIGEALKLSGESQDNSGEPRWYDTLETQLENDLANNQISSTKQVSADKQNPPKTDNPKSTAQSAAGSETGLTVSLDSNTMLEVT